MKPYYERCTMLLTTAYGEAPFLRRGAAKVYISIYTICSGKLGLHVDPVATYHCHSVSGHSPFLPKKYTHGR